MAQDCSLKVPEDFVLSLLPSEELKEKYRRYLFRDYVEVCGCLCLCQQTLNEKYAVVYLEGCIMILLLVSDTDSLLILKLLSSIFVEQHF